VPSDEADATVPSTWLFWQRPLDRVGRSIWRYLPWWKFEDLITNHHLFFTRLRYIVDQEIDVFEGGLANINFERPEVNVESMLRDVLAPGQAVDTIAAITRDYGDPAWVRRMQEWVRDQTYVNCWFTDEFESERMWQDYVPDGDGVVVQSTVRLLVASLEQTPGSVQIDSVIYYDPATDIMVPPDIFRTPLYKHTTYRHEREFRCYVVAPQSHGRYVQHAQEIGYWVPCDPLQLLQRVRTSPQAPVSLTDRVREICERAGLYHVQFERSALER
jgi:hypothetical protein